MSIDPLPWRIADGHDPSRARRNTIASTCSIGGRWEASRSSRSGPVFNPSTGSRIATVPFCTADEVDRAVQAAAAALPAWAETPVVERARVMFRFRERLAAHARGACRLVTREHGKTLAEARASVQRGIEMVEFACGIPSLLMGQSLANIARQVDCETIRHPVGVCVGITPVQLPGDGAALDVPGRDHLRQHVRPEALGEGAAVGGAAGRAADGIGAARGRLQHRARRPRVRRCAA